MTELLPTGQYCFHLPGGYRYATADETEINNNLEPIENAVLVWMEGTTGDSTVFDLAVPKGYRLPAGVLQHLSHDLSDIEG